MWSAEFTTLAAIQLLAILSIPVSLLVVAFARVTVQKPIRTQDVLTAAQFALIPALLVLSVQKRDAMLGRWSRNSRAGGGQLFPAATHRLADRE